jgi:hypothetical protein
MALGQEILVANDASAFSAPVAAIFTQPAPLAATDRDT